MSGSDSSNPDLKDVSHGADIIVVTTIFTVLMIITTFMRLGTKIWIRPKITPDDYFIVLSLAFNVLTSAVEYECVENGFGRHEQFLSDDKVHGFQKWSSFSILLADLSLWSVKISISLFILGLIKGTHKYLRWLVYALLFYTTAMSFTQAVMWGFQARPLRKLWNPDVEGTVAPKKFLVDSIILFAVSTITTDLFYALSPIYFLAKVQMSQKRKIVILSLTSAGLIPFVVSVVRVGFVGSFFKLDETWNLVPVYLLTVVERNVAVIVANLPVLVPLYRHISPKISSYVSRTWRTASSASSTHSSKEKIGSPCATDCYPRTTVWYSTNCGDECANVVYDNDDDDADHRNKSPNAIGRERDTRWGSQDGTLYSDTAQLQRPDKAATTTASHKRDDDNVIHVQREVCVLTQMRQQRRDQHRDRDNIHEMQRRGHLPGT